MAPSAEDWSFKLSYYEKMADDESASPELRLAFARKANWLRILTRCQEVRPKSNQTATKSCVGIEPEALLFSPARLAASRTQSVAGCQSSLKNLGANR
jgi:hypothetical protein